MALVRSLLNATTDQIASTFNEILEYAGGDFASRLKFSYIQADSIAYGCFYNNDVTPSTTNYIFGFKFGGGGYGQVCARAADTDSSTVFQEYLASTRYNDDTFNIVATKYGIAIYKSIGNVPITAGVLTMNNLGEFVSVIADTPLSNPIVIPRNPAYISAIRYPSVASSAFGLTSLSYVPVPTYDGTPRWLPNLAYANATQYVMNGPVLMDRKIWYCIGGAFYLYEGEATT